MPTAGAFAGRLGEVATATTLGGSYTDIEKLKSPRFRGTNKTADVSSNDSAGVEEFIYTWTNCELSFDLISDENATGQEALWTSYLNQTKLYYRMRPRGNSAGERQVRVQGLITSLEYNGDSGDAARYSATIQGSGAITRDTQ